MDPHHRTRTAPPASGTCTCSRRSSPTSTGRTPTCVAEFEDVLRFWFDRGVARHPDRLGRAAGQGRRRCPRCPAHPGPGEHPHVDRDELHDVYRGWRAVADSYEGTRVLVGEVWLAGQGAVRAVPASRRDAHRLQLRLHGAAVGRQAAARVDRHHARRARPRRRAGHLGAVQPRRHAPGHPVRPRGHVVRVHRQAVRHPDRPGRRACAGRGPRPCSRPPCPARCTSTRATSWACPRSRTCRWTCCRTRCTSAPRASTPAGTAAGCRCPGPGPPRRTGSGPAGRGLAPAARRLGGADRRGAGGRPRARPCTSTATSWRSAGPSPPWATAR